MSADRDHWERIHADKGPGAVSWFEDSPRSSLAMIDASGVAPDEPIIDVGGGSSRLAAELLRRGHTDITVLDISSKALEKARAGLPVPEPGRISWVVGDIRSQDLNRQFALWHDRAVFHFMVSPDDRRAYLENLERSLALGGHVVLATFGPDGPDRCSGLPVVRYSAEGLAETVGDAAELVASHYMTHRTPAGEDQQFLFAHLMR